MGSDPISNTARKDPILLSSIRIMSADLGPVPVNAGAAESLPGQLLEKIWYLLIWANCGDLFFVLLADLQKIEQRGPERERRNFHQFPFLNHNSVDGLFLELKVNTENFTNTIGQIV